MNPIFSIGDYYKARFGERVQKVPVSISESCPNREGIRGMETCVFCDPWGSAAYPEGLGQELSAQIEEKKSKLGVHYRTHKFLVYFQTYTSTFQGTQKLERQVEVALSSKDVVGVIFGTRPDCLSSATLDFFAKLTERTFVSIELGVQTFSQRGLDFLKRGHSLEQTYKSSEKLRKIPNLFVGAHLIFGLPDETDADAVFAADEVNRLKFDSVKLHNLHVLKNTGLEKLFQQGQFKPMELEAYAKRIVGFLEHLDPKIAVERLSALSSHWDQLVAPQWNSKKLMVAQFIFDLMKKKGSVQGSLFESESGFSLPSPSAETIMSSTTPLCSPESLPSLV